METNLSGRTREWLRGHKREVFIFFLVFLIATTSFALGYIARSTISHAPIIVEQVAR